MKTNSNGSAIQEDLASSIHDHSNNPVNHKSINPLSDAQTFERLARLSPAEYDRSRKAEARRLRVRIETLDAEVAECRSELGRQAILHSALSTLPSLVPWPEPVDG